MKSQINIMRQLQELVLTRDEHHQTGDGSHLDALNESIDALRAKLEPQLATIYERLYKKNHVIMAAMSNGCCAACGMQVPISQGQQVRLAQHLVTCSSCGRVLFADEEDAAHHVAAQKPVDKDRDERDEPKTGISRFSAPELVVVDLDAKTPEEAIGVLADAMEKNKFIENADSLVAAAMERESVLSTAMGNGLAFPHVRGVEGGGLTLAVGVSKKGIKWDGASKVSLVFLTAIPVAVSAFYLRLMSGIVQSFSKAANVKAMTDAKDAEAAWKALCKATRTTVR